jgi:hypothetical protein
MSEIKASINNSQVIGELLEMNLEEITKEVTLKGANGVEKKVTCQQMAKKDFKNPMFLVDVKGNAIGVDFFPASEKKLDDNGQLIDNPNFKSLKTVLENYIPKNNAKDGEVPTRVKIDGILSANEYINKDTYEFKSITQVNGFRITSTGVPEEDSADCEISGIIRSIIPETKGEDAEETGRLKVELYTFNRNAETTPFTFIVEADLADDFNSFYEAGQSVKLYYEIITKQVGAKKPTTGGFGRRESHMVRGFGVTEYSVFRGDEAFDEENEYYINPEDMKQALNERDIKIDNMVKTAKENKDKPKSSPKGASSSGAKANPFGSASTKKSPF